MGGRSREELARGRGDEEVCNWRIAEERREHKKGNARKEEGRQEKEDKKERKWKNTKDDDKGRQDGRQQEDRERGQERRQEKGQEKYGNKNTTNNTTGVIAIDPWLAPFKDALKRRFSKANDWIKKIEETEGSLDKFSQGAEKFGLNVDKSNNIVYREWAPNATHASLVGDFNDWNRDAHPMTKNDFGVFEITLPAKNGETAIPHNSKIKISLTLPSGERVDRLPAWIKYVTQDLSVSPAYDARFWNPPDRKSVV